MDQCWTQSGLVAVVAADPGHLLSTVHVAFEANLIPKEAHSRRSVSGVHSHVARHCDA